MAETSLKVLMELDTKKMDSAVEKEKKKLEELRQKENQTDTTNMRYDQKREKAQGDIDRKMQQIKDAEEGVKRAEEALNTFIDENGEVLEQIERYRELDFKFENLPDEESLPMAEWKEYNELGNLLHMTDAQSDYDTKMVKLSEDIEDAKDNVVKLKNELKELEGKRDIIQVEQDRYIENKKTKEEIKEQEKLIRDMEKEEKEITKHKQQNNGFMTAMNKGAKGILNSVLRWGLALFGIRSIYSFITSSVSTISRYDEQLGANIQYIRFALAMTIKPIVEWIVKAVYKILNALGAIIYELTGFNIYENSGVEEFNKGLNDAKKTLMGFDEANIISDSGKAKVTPDISFDSTIDTDFFDDIWNKILSFIEKVKKKLRDTINEINEFLKKPKMFDDAFGNWSLMFQGITKLGRDFLKGLEDLWYIFIEGPFKIIMGLIKGDWGKVWEGCTDIFTHFIDYFANQIRMIIDVVQIVVGAIWGVVKSAWDALYNFIYENITYPLAVKILEIRDKLVSAWNYVYNNVVQKVWSAYNTYVRPIISAVSNVFSGLTSGAKAFINFFIDGINKIIDGLNKVKIEVPWWVPGLGGKSWGFNLKKIPRLDMGGIVLAQPGHGVPVGGAIMSERRSEAVIPFENPTAMEKIGEAIGKYVNIAIDNRLEVDGRVLATATNNQISKERFLMNR